MIDSHKRTSGHSTNNSKPVKRESPNLDILRSLAVLAVFYGHFRHTFGEIPAPIVRLAHCGVLIFFVHTSLVLMMSMERLAQDGARLFISFYTRRAFRIYPLSMATVLTMLALHIPSSTWTLPYHSFSFPEVVSNILLIQNINYSPLVLIPLWSLPYEVQMYLALPLLFLFARRIPSPWLSGLLWMLAFFGCVLAAKIHPLAGQVLQFVPCFVAGVIAYQIMRVVPYTPLPSWSWPVFILVLAAGYSYSEPAPGSALSRLRPEWTLCLVLGLGLPFFREAGALGIRRLASIIAKYSYGIYLSHLPIMWFAFFRLKEQPPFVQWIVFASLALSVPAVLYHVVELPLIKSGASLANRWDRRGEDLPQHAALLEIS